MTLHALDFFVHSAEGIARFIVVKFRDAADGFPTRRGVAIFARNVKGAVWIARNGQFRRSRRTLGKGLKR